VSTKPGELHDAITTEESRELGESDCKKALVFGMPIIQAYESEKHAPPFGIFIHESARSFAPNDEKPIPHIWLLWANKTTAESLKTKLVEQYEWYSEHSQTQSYPKDRIEFHKKMPEEYFALYVQC